MKQTRSHIAAFLVPALSAVFLTLTGCKKEYITNEYGSRVDVYKADFKDRFGEQVDNGSPVWKYTMRSGLLNIGSLNTGDEVVAIGSIIAGASGITTPINLAFGLALQADTNLLPNTTNPQPAGLHVLSRSADFGWPDHWENPAYNYFAHRQGSIKWTGPATTNAYLSVYVRPVNWEGPIEGGTVEFRGQSLSVIVVRAN